MRVTVEDALCREVDPDLWFPEPAYHGNDAKRICGSCPLIEACLEYALTAEPSVDGIWGGTSPRQRVRIRSQRGIRLASNNHRGGAWAEWSA